MSEYLDRLKREVADLLPFRDDETFDEWSDRARKRNHGTRALLAAAMAHVSKMQQREVQLTKNQWIAAARLSFKPGRRRNCKVCGKYWRVAHAHHVVPLNRQFSLGYVVPDHSHIWLCPTHHAVVHLMLDDDNHQRLGRKAVEVLSDLLSDEFEVIIRLLGFTDVDLT